MTPSSIVIAGGIGGAIATGVLCRGVFAPASRIWGRVHYRGATSGIALTFDDGPHAEITPVILDILRKANAPAMFFVVGRHAAEHPWLLRRIRDEGHLVGNHSLDHDAFGALRFGGYWHRQIDGANEIIERILGERPMFFRPPMGLKTPHITAAARGSQLHTVTWSQRARDGWPTTASAIVRRLSSRVSAGDIILMHDGTMPPFRRDPHATVAALPTLINHWRSRGLRIMPLNELLQITGRDDDQSDASPAGVRAS